MSVSRATQEDTNNQAAMEAISDMGVTLRLHMQDNHQRDPMEHRVRGGLMLPAPEGLRLGLMGATGVSLREDTTDLQVTTGWGAPPWGGSACFGCDETVEKGSHCPFSSPPFSLTQ